MGSFYVSFAVRDREPAAVANSLRAARREALVTARVKGITFFYDRAADQQREEDVVSVARTVSQDLRAHVLAVLNHDDDVLVYCLFANGELLDEYNSCPDYFMDGDDAPTGGNAVQLCAAFEVPAKVAEVERALHHTHYVFEHERHAALAELLGLPREYADKSYRSLFSCLDDPALAKIVGIDPGKILRIDLEEPPAGAAATAARQVTLRELERETAHLPFLSWVGSDKRFHYFATREGRRYRVNRSEWRLPPHLGAFLPRPGDGMALFVTVKDGKVTIPDPRKMADLSDQDMLPPSEW